MKIFPVLLSCLITLSFCSAPKAPPRPNIIILVADDLGWKDSGFMGSSFYETPHIDKLAEQGMVFMQAYAGAANCAPSRACLMSGQNTPRHGVYTVSPSTRGNTKTRKLIPVVNNDSLDDSFLTLAEELKTEGYTSISLGKWHLGENPLTQGFDYNVGGNVWGHPVSYFAPYIKPDLPAKKGTFLTDHLTREANRFIRENKKNKFFVYFPFYAVHTPLQPKKHLENKFDTVETTGCQNNPKYAAMITNMDSCIGSILQTLREEDLEKNTLVFFTSDNGGIRDISCQDPLRAGKGSYYEGGIRVPLIVKWPGKIEAGTKSEVPVVNMDFYPTILEAIHKKPENALLDGVSILPILTQSGEIAERSLFWHFPIYLQAYNPENDQGKDPLFRTRPGSVIRSGDWKLHYYYENGETELYRLSNDPGETNNLSGEYPEKTKELLNKLMQWLEKTNSPQLFKKNPEYDPDFEKEALNKYSL